MHIRTNIIAMFMISGLVSTSSWCFAQAVPPQDPAEVLKKEKEDLAERLRRAEMQEAMISYQRQQLDIEQREILKLQKEIAAKERRLRTRPPQDTLKKRLEAQSNILAEARRQLDDARHNLALQIEALRSEIERQELERKSFISTSRMNALKRRQAGQERRAAAVQEREKKREEDRQARAAEAQAKEEARLRKRESARKSVLKDKEDRKREREEIKRRRDEARQSGRRRRIASAQEREKTERLRMEQWALEKAVAEQAARARKDAHISDDEKMPKRVRLVQEQALQNELDACRRSLALMENEINSVQRQTLQERIDKLLEKQQSLLHTSLRVEHELLQQKKNVEVLLDQAGATAISGELK